MGLMNMVGPQAGAPQPAPPQGAPRPGMPAQAPPQGGQNPVAQALQILQQAGVPPQILQAAAQALQGGQGGQGGGPQGGPPPQAGGSVYG